MSGADGVDVRGFVTARLGGYAVIVALLTAGGLWFAAGIRGVEVWGSFAIASLVGIGGAVWGVRLALASVSGTFGARPSDLGRDGSEAVASPIPSSEDTKAEPPDEPDEVDYLMALRHEFRTPLNAVLGFSDVLLSGIDGEVNASQREDLEIIRASGIRLRILLDSALDLSQLTAGELRVSVERTDIRELVARVAVEAGQLWSNKRRAGCTLPDEPCVTDADEARLRRSILVLADFLATDHRDAEIGLKLSRSAQHLAIEITADPSDRLNIDALPTPAEVLAAEDAMEIRRWPVAVTSEVITRHDGSLYHGDHPSRFMIRIPLRGAP
jgi:signal transduction histidine kinase